MVIQLSKNAKLFNKAGKDYGVSSSYGQRNLTVNGKKLGKYHIGTDYLFPQGTELVLPVDVEIIGVNTGHGDYGGHVFAYSKELDGTFHPSHMSRIDVKKGDIVKAGTVIGLSGGARGTHGAGTSTGAHLHIGWYAKGKKIDTGKGTMGDGQWIDIEKVDFTIKVDTFKPYQFTIPAGATLYDVNGKFHDIKTTRDHNVTILEENRDLNQGRFKASWLIGVIDAWVKLSGVASHPKKQESKPKPVSAVGKTWRNILKPLPLYDGNGNRHIKPSRATRSYKILAEKGDYYQIQHVLFNPSKVWVKKIDGKLV